MRTGEEKVLCRVFHWIDSLDSHLFLPDGLVGDSRYDDTYYFRHLSVVTSNFLRVHVS